MSWKKNKAQMKRPRGQRYERITMLMHQITSEGSLYQIGKCLAMPSCLLDRLLCILHPNIADTEATTGHIFGYGMYVKDGTNTHADKKRRGRNEGRPRLRITEQDRLRTGRAFHMRSIIAPALFSICFEGSFLSARLLPLTSPTSHLAHLSTKLLSSSTLIFRRPPSPSASLLRSAAPCNLL